MVNIGFSWSSLLGIALALSGAGLYFMRSVRPSLARDHDIFFAAVGLLCGGILFFQGWRQDPILQFGQFLLTGSVIFFAVESIRLRGIATEQAKRNVPFVDDERPVSRVYRAELDELEPMEEPQPYTRRIRGTEDPREERATEYAAPARSRRRPPTDAGRPEAGRPEAGRPGAGRRPGGRTPPPEAPPRRPRRPATRPDVPGVADGRPVEPGGYGENDWGESDWGSEPPERPSRRPSRRPPSDRPTRTSSAVPPSRPPRRDQPVAPDPLANERTGYVYGSSYEDADDPVDESYVDYQPVDPDEPPASSVKPAEPTAPRPTRAAADRLGYAEDEADNSADFDDMDSDDFDDDPRDRRFDVDADRF